MHFEYLHNDTSYYFYDAFPKYEEVFTLIGTYNCLLQLATHETSEMYGNKTLIDSSYYSEIGPVQRSYAYLSGTKIVGKIIDYKLE